MLKTTSKRDVVNAFCRKYFLAFLMKAFETLHPGRPPLRLSWYLQALTNWAEEIAEGKHRRSVISMPPRMLKTITMSVCFPAWLLGRDPTKSVMVICYGEELSLSLAHQMRRLVESPWYRRAFPKVGFSRAGQRFSTAEGGSCRFVSLRGPITGMGADIIVLDDLLKAADAGNDLMRENTISIFRETIASRLNDSRGVIVSIQQRLHEYDTQGYLIEQGFEQLHLPAINDRPQRIELGRGCYRDWEEGKLLCPERLSQADLDERKRELGSQAYSAQYLQNPVAAEGDFFKIEWFGRYEYPADTSQFSHIVQSWDTAITVSSTANWSVCTTWGYADGKFYLLDVFRDRLEHPELRMQVKSLERKWRPIRIIIENSHGGCVLQQELQRDGETAVRLYKPNRSKEDRAVLAQPWIERGDVLLPDSGPEWLAPFVAELKAFPNGRYDDQVDSLTQLLTWMQVFGGWLLSQRRDPVTGRLLTNRRWSARRPGRRDDPSPAGNIDFARLDIMRL